ATASPPAAPPPPPLEEPPPEPPPELPDEDLGEGEEEAAPRRKKRNPLAPPRRRDDDEEADAPGGGDLAPHQGVVVLVLGILSLVFFCIPVAGLAMATIALIIGGRNRREMAAGQMDLSGQGMVTAGWICSIVGTVLGGLTLLCCAVRVIYFLI